MGSELRNKRRCEDNIKMELRGVECGFTNWIDLSQDRDRQQALVNVAMKLRVP